MPSITQLGRSTEADLDRMRGQFFVDGDAAGAKRSRFWVLLFSLVNVAAILVTACIVLDAFGAHAVVVAGDATSRNRRRSLQFLVGFVLCVTVPLTVGSVHITQARSEEAAIRSAAADWGRPSHWTVVNVERSDATPVVTLRGPLPAPDVEELRRRLDDAGLASLDVRMELVPTTEVELPGN